MKKLLCSACNRLFFKVDLIKTSLNSSHILYYCGSCYEKALSSKGTAAAPEKGSINPQT